MKLLLQVLALVVVSTVSLAGFAQTNFVEGQHYFRMDQPVGTDKPSKIEVVEVFQYTCPACFRFESLSREWKKNQPDDVSYVPLHAQFNTQSPILMRAMYTAQALRKFDTIHPALFNAFHVAGNQLRNKEQIKNVFTANGIDGERFDKTWDSFGINSLVKRGIEKVRELRVSATPQLAVGGVYSIGINEYVPDQETMLEVAGFLVNRIRAERGLE